MNKNVYRRLAQRLDAMPNGFPATESGIELRLLAKIFTAEEAKVAATMTGTPESSSTIAAHLDLEFDTLGNILTEMVGKGLIFTGMKNDQRVFGLRPFIVGIYENQLPRIDSEMAGLFEQYYQETQGLADILRSPSVHRIIPVEKSLSFDLEIFPYERATELLEKAKSFGVRDCICRIQQHLIGHDCGHPVEVCLVFSPFEGTFDKSEVDRALTKEEAKYILRQASEAGLIHSTSNNRDENFYICNCCTCSCGVLRGVAEFGHLTAAAHSDFRSIVNTDLCVGCGECVEHCQFGALTVLNGICVVESDRCMGCGLCISTCPTDALQLKRLPAAESAPLPANPQEWASQRVPVN
jgi:ferredoxin